MKHQTCFFPYIWGLLLITLLFPAIAQADETPRSGSVYGTLTSVSSIENQWVFSIFDGQTFCTLTASADAPCLYQGQRLPLQQLQPGSQALFSYTDQKISSILVLSCASNQTIASSVYGMFYNFTEGKLLITLPGGELKTCSLSDSVAYYVNNSQVSYKEFFQLSLPGDDIKVYFNSKNEAVKIESYVTKDNEMAKTNPNLLQ